MVEVICHQCNKTYPLTIRETAANAPSMVIYGLSSRWFREAYVDQVKVRCPHCKFEVDLEV